MGAEAMCTAEFNGQRSQGKALLETHYVLFRGDFPLNIPFSDIQKIAADESHVTIQFAGGDAKFDLGPTSRKWMQKIQHPPSLFDKLGVKAGLRIALSGVEDEEFSASLRSLAGTFVKK